MDAPTSPPLFASPDPDAARAAFAAARAALHRHAGHGQDRARRRAELFKNQDWLAYLKKAQPLVASQESRVLLPTDFSPVR
jgi:hypothetical protein